LPAALDRWFEGELDATTLSILRQAPIDQESFTLFRWRVTPPDTINFGEGSRARTMIDGLLSEDDHQKADLLLSAQLQPSAAEPHYVRFRTFVADSCLAADGPFSAVMLCAVFTQSRLRSRRTEP